MQLYAQKIIDNKYQLLHPIGSGGFGEVWLAKRLLLGDFVAIKVLHLHKSDDPARSIERFKNEAKITASLSHPNILKVYDLFESEDEVFIIYEYINGLPLDVLIEKITRDEIDLSESEALSIVYKVLKALEYAHDPKSGEGSVLHRDISPHNIIVGIHGEVKLIDFGISKLINDEEEKTKSTSYSFKYCYSSPELWSEGKYLGQNYCETNDIYSVGLILYELLTKKKAFPEYTIISSSGSYTDPSEYRTLSNDLRELLKSWLSADTSKRPSISDLLNKISEFNINTNLQDIVKKYLNSSSLDHTQTASVAQTTTLKQDKFPVSIVSLVIGAILLISGFMAFRNFKSLPKKENSLSVLIKNKPITMKKIDLDYDFDVCRDPCTFLIGFGYGVFKKYNTNITEAKKILKEEFKPVNANLLYNLSEYCSEPYLCKEISDYAFYSLTENEIDPKVKDSYSTVALNINSNIEKAFKDFENRLKGRDFSNEGLMGLRDGFGLFIFNKVDNKLIYNDLTCLSFSKMAFSTYLENSISEEYDIGDKFIAAYSKDKNISEKIKLVDNSVQVEADFKCLAVFDIKNGDIYYSYK